MAVHRPETPVSAASDQPIRIGISSCLLGLEVRYDGRHKRDDFLVETLGRWVEWVSVCPEVELGMGIPREPVRLVRSGGELRMVGTESGVDHSRAMHRYAARRVSELAKLDLCGYVLKKGSPSCGMAGVKVHPARKGVTATGRGLYSDALTRALPHLPVEEEARLADRRLREHFIERIFACRRLRRLFCRRWTERELLAFHAAHELQLMAHSPTAAAADLQRLVKRRKSRPRAELRARYEAAFMNALAIPATPQLHANVLRHALRSFGTELDAVARGEVLDVIREYRSGRAPLIAALKLVRDHAHRLDVAHLKGQSYLEPTAAEMELRWNVKG